MKVVTSAQMRDIEETAVKRGTSFHALMQRAGEAVAHTTEQLLADGPALILVGPGNNGGDGLVAAKTLHRKGHRVVVYTFRRQDLMQFTGRVVRAENDPDHDALKEILRESRVIVDALLGIGQSRPPDDGLARILHCVNENGHHKPRVAIDIPTGVNADTGAVPGEAFRAGVTLCMGFLKCGNVVYPGAEYGGQVRMIDLDFPADIAEKIPTSIPSDTDVANLLPRRGLNANKGSSGRLLFVGGSADYLGAPALCASAAYRAGAGLVELAIPKPAVPSVAAHLLEAIFLPLADTDGRIAPAAVPCVFESLQRAAALVIGPGMGLSDSTIEVVHRLVRALTPDMRVVVDADGLNALSRLGEWWNQQANLVLTPHPGEMSRLTGLPIGTIQSDRLSTARHYSREWGKVVVLKGAGTVVASPEGKAVINPTGGPNLATAGTGDVLSGIIGGLLAQGCAPYQAAVAGVYLHGRAGDLLRAEHGDVGTVAGDLLTVLSESRASILKESEVLL